MKHKPRNGYTLAELMIVLLIVGVIAAILFPVVARMRENPGGKAYACQSNLKQIGLGFMLYAQDNDDALPTIALNAVPSSLPPYSPPYGWADALQPYVKSTQIFQCPLDEHPSNPDATQSGFTDYWFNTNLNARNLNKLPHPTNVFLLGEGNDGSDGTDARYNLDVLPQRWIDDAKSPCWRHQDMGNYLFADGHVKALAPDKIAPEMWLPGAKP